MHTMIHLNDRSICNIFISIRISFLWEFLFLSVTKVGKSGPVLFSLPFILKTEGGTIMHHRRPEWRPESDHRLPTSAKPSFSRHTNVASPTRRGSNLREKKQKPPMGVLTGTTGAKPSWDCAPTDNIGAATTLPHGAVRPPSPPIIV